jgi:hypothetical protein
MVYLIKTMNFIPGFTFLLVYFVFDLLSRTNRSFMTHL